MKKKERKSSLLEDASMYDTKYKETAAQHFVAEHHTEFKYRERPETNIVSHHIQSNQSVSDALKILGEKTSKGETIVVLIPSRGMCSSTIVIPEGVSAIITKHGRCLGTYKAGFYCIPAWFDIAFIVTQNYIPYHFHVRECPTRDNVKIQLHVDIVFHIVDPIKFVYNIGPEKMEELLRATQAESVRTLVRTITVDKAYNLRGEESEDMIRALNDKLSEPYGVSVDNVVIVNVTLPGDIAFAMQNETTFDSKQREQKKKQEFEVKVQNDNNYLKRVAQDREMERLKASETCKRQLEITNQEIKVLETKMNKVLAEIEADQKLEVNRINAEAGFEAGKINAEKEKISLELEAKGKAEVAKVEAEAEKYVIEVKSKAAVTTSQLKGEATSVESKAEKDAALKLKAKREYELELRKIQVWKSLSSNNNTVITGDSGDNLPAQMYAFYQANQVFSTHKQGTSQQLIPSKT